MEVFASFSKKKRFRSFLNIRSKKPSIVWWLAGDTQCTPWRKDQPSGGGRGGDG
jgi:hypothetical protein